MIHIKEGNIFEAETQGIVNPVNCVGVMGAGLAKKFAQFYPEMEVEYKKVCDEDRLVPGKIFMWMIDTPEAPLYIFNLPTKVHWKDPSKMEYIRYGVSKLIELMDEHEIGSVAIPAIGCGLGGLKWEDVFKEIVHQFQRESDKTIWLYPPKG